MAEFDYDVIIVGSGPAGTSTALHLCRRNPERAPRILMLDQHTHPREKLCGGGVTHYGEEALAELGLEVPVQYFAVREVELRFRRTAYSFRGNPAFRIVRRDEFDHWLAREAMDRGVLLREGECVQALERNADGVRVRTDRGTYTARVLVGADGSKSLVRRLCRGDAHATGDANSSFIAAPAAPQMARLVEVLTPENAGEQPEFRDGRAVFDFSRMTDGLQGYYWDFPSWIKGTAYMNRGLFDSRSRPERPRAVLKQELASAMRKRDRQLDGPNTSELKGHPIRIYNSRENPAIERVLFVGDAAGADPLFGEGIAFAIAYGAPAAEAIEDAFTRGDFRFADYGQRILKRPIFRHLRLRVRLARIAYRMRSPWFVAACWRIAGVLVRFTPWRSRQHVPAKARAFPAG